MSRRVQPSCRRTVPPSSGAGCCGWEDTELTACGEGQGLEARGPGGTDKPGAPVCSPFSRGAGARARPAACSPRRALSPDPRGGARSAIFPCSRARAGPRGAPAVPEPGTYRWNPISPWASWPAPGSAPCSRWRRSGPAPPPPSLCARSPWLREPCRPRLQSPRPPRLRLALGPRARATPGAQARTGLFPLLLLQPLPPRRALNHPAPPPPDNRPSGCPALAGARPGLSWAVGGSWPSLPSSEGRASFALNRPPGTQAAAPEPPPLSPEVIRGPARAGGGGTRPTPEGRTERGRRAGGVVRGALALFPQLRTPDSGGGNCGEGEGGGVGDGSAAAALIAFIRRCLPSRRRRGMWTPLIGREGPARRGRHGPAPSPRLPPPPRD